MCKVNNVGAEDRILLLLSLLLPTKKISRKIRPPVRTTETANEMQDGYLPAHHVDVH